VSARVRLLTCAFLALLSALPLIALKRLFALCGGLALNVTSAYSFDRVPTKALTNLIFISSCHLLDLLCSRCEMSIQVFGDASLDEVAMIAKGN